MSPRLWGMMWGAEDLAASLGASRNRTDGRFHSPFWLARDLCLIAAAAAGVVAIDTIATDINDLDALREESIAARQDGFLAKAVIHPKHVDVVNAAFMPTDEEIAWSERVVAAFEGNPVRRREDGRQDAGQAASSRRGEDSGDAAAVARGSLAPGVLPARHDRAR